MRSWAARAVGGDAPLPEPGARNRANRRRVGPARDSSVRLPDATITARRVIVAVGGASYPGCGTTGDGYAIARRFGHTIVDPRPALVPLRVGADWVPGLKGLSLPDVVASVYRSHGTSCSQSVARPCFSRTSGSAVRRSSTSAGRPRIAAIPSP